VSIISLFTFALVVGLSVHYAGVLGICIAGIGFTPFLTISAA